MGIIPTYIMIHPQSRNGRDSPQGMAMMLAEEAAGSDIDVRSFSAVPPGVNRLGGPPGDTGHLRCQIVEHIVYHCALNLFFIGVVIGNFARNPFGCCDFARKRPA